MDQSKLAESRRCVDALGAKARELFPDEPAGTPAKSVRSDDMAEFARYVFDALDAVLLALES